MKFLVASDKFKGSLMGEEACNAIKEGVLMVFPNADVKTLPLADGGEGSLEAIEKTLGFKRVRLIVSNPCFKPIETFYGLKENIAYIEMAKASGLLLVSKEEQSALNTTTLGTGEMIKDAIKKGAKKIYLFVGGSATNDGGIGMAQALGFEFFDSNNCLLAPIGASLSKIRSVGGKLIEGAETTEFVVVTDVKNSLYGKNGAAHVFAAQKGANSNDINELDNGLRNFSSIAIKMLGKDVSNTSGAGAAGGLGGGAIIFLDAILKPGVNTIMNILKFDNFIKNSDFVITGEGKLDAQTLEGKVIKGVMDKCTLYNKPVGIVCGINEIPMNKLNELPISACLPIMDGLVTLEEAITNAYSLAVVRASQVVRSLIN